MPIFVDPKTGEQFENYEPDAAEKAAQFGFVPQEQYDKEQRSGGLGATLQTIPEELGRLGATAAGVAAPLVSPASRQLSGREVAPTLFESGAGSPLERREVNPGAVGIGQAIPAVAAGIALPGAGLAGLAATIGVDAASGLGQAAVDAEVENRGISGEEVVRNTGFSLMFSLPLFGAGAAAAKYLGAGSKRALERSADAARDVASRRAAAAEGAELAEAVADPAIQADLMDRVASSAEDAVERAHSRVADFSPPPVAKNPNAQREAVGAIADVYRTANPDLAARLDDLTKGSSKKRLEGLRAIRDELASAGDSETLTAIDATIGREDLWGSKAVRGTSDIDAVLGSRPGPGASPEELTEWAAKVRAVRGGELAGLADEIEQLAERQLEIRTASTIGESAPAAVNDVVDYGKAMREMDPAEAWRLTREGADDGLREVESASVSDAMQRVDDVLREDVAMSVKREDFVKGAETWSPAQVAKQDAWAQTTRERALALAGELNTAEPRGYRIGGFAREAVDLIDRAVQRIGDADPVTRNYEIDGLKRSLDSVAKRLAASGPAIDESSKAWGTKRILELADDMRKGLEDAELWGRNAGLQKETNAAWVKLIEPYSRVTKKMAEFLEREFGVVGAAGIQRRFDPDMINSIMSRGYQRNLRADLEASIKGLDQMMQARQSQGLSHLDRLSQARADLVRIQQGFDFADLLAVAKKKAKAPLGLEIAQRFVGATAPQGVVGSVVGPVISRAGGAIAGDAPLLAPGSKSAMAAAVRRHVGMTRGEQAAMLSDAAFSERLPGSLQRQYMAGAAANDHTVQLAQMAVDATKRDRDLTVRLMVDPEAAKRAKKVRRTKHTPAIERAKARSGQGGSVNIGGGSPVSLAGKSLEDLDAGLLQRRGDWKPKSEVDRAVDSALSPEWLDEDTIAEVTTAGRLRAKVARIAEQILEETHTDRSGVLPKDIRSAVKAAAKAAVDDIDDYAGTSKRAAAKVFGTEGSVRGMVVVGSGSRTLDRKVAKLQSEWDKFEKRTAERDAAEKAWQSAVESELAQADIDALESTFNDLDSGARDALENALNSVDTWLDDAPESFAAMRAEFDSLKGKHDYDPVNIARDMLPILKRSSGEAGNVDISGIAKSPLGVGTGAAGAVVAYAHLKDPSTPDPESTTALERFSEGYERPIDAFRAARKMVMGWSQNPEALIDAITDDIGDVGQQSPRLEREMTAQAMRVASYLQDNLPGQRNVSVVYPEGTPPSRAEVRQFALRFDAAVNPAGVMADARAGRLERVQLDTLQAVWPREYDALRAGVVEQLGTGKATPRTRQRMSLLFNFPSEVDPALGPRTRAIVAAARAAQDEQKAPAPSSPGMNRQRLPSTATLQPAGMAALSLGQQIGSP